MTANDPAGDQTDELFVRLPDRPRNVWTLMSIAVKTGEGQIVQGGFTTMLTSDNVVNLKGRSVEILRHLAVLAAVASAPPYFPFEGLIHEGV